MPSTEQAIRRAPNGVVTDKPIALYMPQTQRDLVERYARGEGRPVAAFARLLLQRGFAAYQQDPRTLIRGLVAGQMAEKHIALRLLPGELEAVTEGARREQRKRAEFARLLTQLGLAEYEAEQADASC